jgi:CMP-N-acetylneuraminic acid synthetase
MSIQTGEVLAFIPARGDSKGLPRKNSRLLVGKPLLAWSIGAALKARLITRVVVSTEDEELADIARAHGAEVPFLRPKEMARDSSLIGEAVDYTLERLAQEEGYQPECLVELYPTHPFRTPALLDFLTGKLLEGFNEVVTVKEGGFCTEELATTDSQGRLQMLSSLNLARAKSKSYRKYGQFNGWRLEGLPGTQFKGYAHVITNPVELVDIDYLEDFYLAESVIAHNLYELG